MANEVSIRNWLAYVEGEAPGAPMIVLLQAINDSLQRFCRETGLWREQTGITINVVANTAEYHINSPHGAIPADLAWVEYDGIELGGKSERELDREYGSDWRSNTASIPRWYYRPDVDLLHLYPIPTTALSGGLVVWPTYQPKSDAEFVPEWLWTEWREGIGDGAKARLLESPSSPWSNLNAALFLEGRFRRAIGRGRQRATTGGVRRSRQIEYQSFGGWGGSG